MTSLDKGNNLNNQNPITYATSSKKDGFQGNYIWSLVIFDTSILNVDNTFKVIYVTLFILAY